MRFVGTDMSYVPADTAPYLNLGQGTLRAVRSCPFPDCTYDVFEVPVPNQHTVRVVVRHFELVWETGCESEFDISQATLQRFLWMSHPPVRPEHVPRPSTISREERSLARAARNDAALALVTHVLREQAVEQIRRGAYRVTSTLNPRVEYFCGMDVVRVYVPSSILPITTFCLQPRRGWPTWDGTLTRIMMLQYDELRFLRTAFEGTSMQPMRRARFKEIYGRLALEAWDAYDPDS